jgi:hypothetical protein
MTANPIVNIAAVRGAERLDSTSPTCPMSLGTNDPCSPMNRVFGRYIAFMVTLTLGISLAAQPVIDWQHDLWWKWSLIVPIALTGHPMVVTS